MDGNTVSYRALNIFRDKLYIFIDFHLSTIYGKSWRVEASRNAKIRIPRESDSMDLPQLISLFYTHYVSLKRHLPFYFPKQVLNIIKSLRNQIMHQQVLGPDEAYRLLDLIKSFLDAIELPDSTILELRRELIKQLYEQEFQGEVRRHDAGFKDEISSLILKHYYVLAPEGDRKTEILVRILQTARHDKVVVYSDTISEYEMLQSRLHNDSWDLICADDNMEESALQSISAIIRESSSIILLSYGFSIVPDLDDEISLVINYTIPRDYTTFVYRMQVLDSCSSYPEVINFLRQVEMNAINAYKCWSGAEIQELFEDIS
jgi:hypothetical protein